jgi:hypothetical protein
MPDRPTLEHVRLAWLELAGRRIEIVSAELTLTQHWRGDEPAQREWEVVGRTHDGDLRDGTQPIAFEAGGRRYRGRVVLTSSVSLGSTLAAFNAVGLGDLVEVPPDR